MFRSLSSFFRGVAPSRSNTSRPAARPRLENLEDRRVLSASLIGGNIVISQSNANDTAVVSEVTVGGEIPLQFYKVQETIGGVVKAPKLFLSNTVTGKVVYKGFNGNDRFDNQTSLKCVAFGGAGRDFLAGGHSDDVLVGGDDNDQMHAREGNDVMLGQGGDDLMRAGQGDDRMFGGTGKDDMFGALGDDFLDGGNDGRADILRGSTGADIFVAEPVRILFFSFNRDKPKDFSAAEGDLVV